MKKAKRSIVVIIMVACMLATLVLSGCSEKVEERGIYYYLDTVHSTIEQGQIMQTFSDTITIYSDNTFSSISTYYTLYSSDGETWAPAYSNCNIVYGTYEISNEDADLGEKTMKITGITGYYDVVGNSKVDASKFTEAAKAKINEEIINKEFILTSDSKISEKVSIGGFIGAMKENNS